MNVQRANVMLRPDPARVLVRPFNPPSQNRAQKIASRVLEMEEEDVRSLLDVGCRDAILRKHLRPQIEYTGVDIVAGPGVDKVANIEDGLPFADGEFDAVVAMYHDQGHIAMKLLVGWRAVNISARNDPPKGKAT